MQNYEETKVLQRPLSAAEAAAVKPEQAAVAYQYPETRDLVALVRDAAAIVRAKGEEAFNDFRQQGSRWQKEDTYIFVLDPKGNMLVHADPGLVGKNQMDLKDINGKPIIQGLIKSVTSIAGKTEGWYHYEWPVPGGLLPRWKSSFVQLVKAPSGNSYIVGSGMYNDRMEREFVIDMVSQAVMEIEQQHEAAFELFRDPAGPFRVKDAYIFVIDLNGIELFNPVFRVLEGVNVLDVTDTEGKYFHRTMVDVAKTQGSGWIDYMWPKPGESISTLKSSYVHIANLNGKKVLVGSGVYLADAPKAVQPKGKMSAAELETLVREAATLLEKKGEEAFPEFRQEGSKWLHDEIYFWVWSMDGKRILHPQVHTIKPETEGKDVRMAVDAIGKPYGKMFLETASSLHGEGWIHCMWPKPHEFFPTWKSCFIKRVTFPSGKDYLVGSGVYDMQIDHKIIEETVNRAAALVAGKGEEAFDLLRDKKGPFYFMDTYVFVDTPNGVEVVNPAFKGLEGKNLMEVTDLRGKHSIRDYIDAAIKKETAWVDYYWYKPGENTPAHKYTFVRKVQHKDEIYIVGAGYYKEEEKTQ